jgi:hypothetical protein
MVKAREAKKSERDYDAAFSRKAKYSREASVHRTKLAVSGLQRGVCKKEDGSFFFAEYLA